MIRAALSIEEAGRWDLMIALALSALWLLWAVIVWSDVRGGLKARRERGVVVGCLCRTRHQEGDCPRDRKPADD